MPKVHAIRTGLVQVRRPQMERRRNGLARVTDMLYNPEWTPWLPIYAWIIEHDEGLIMVDTGETSHVHQRGYHPSWLLSKGGSLLSTSRRGNWSATSRTWDLASRRASGGPHTSSHRPRRRIDSLDGQQVLGIGKRMEDRKRIRRQASRVSAASLA